MYLPATIPLSFSVLLSLVTVQPLKAPSYTNHSMTPLFEMSIYDKSCPSMPYLFPCKTLETNSEYLN